MNLNKQRNYTILLIFTVFLVFVILLVLQELYIFLRVTNYILDNLSMLISTIYQVACSVYSLYQYLAVILKPPKRTLKIRWEHIYDQEQWHGIPIENVTQIRTTGR